jgi:hypothetical protein
MDCPPGLLVRRQRPLDDPHGREGTNRLFTPSCRYTRHYLHVLGRVSRAAVLPLKRYSHSSYPKDKVFPKG